MRKDNFNARMPDPTVAQRFTDFLLTKGTKKGYAVQGAIQLFMCLPPDLREMLVEGKIKKAQAWFRSRETAWKRRHLGRQAVSARSAGSDAELLRQIVDAVYKARPPPKRDRKRKGDGTG